MAKNGELSGKTGRAGLPSEPVTKDYGKQDYYQNDMDDTMKEIDAVNKRSVAKIRKFGTKQH